MAGSNELDQLWRSQAGRLQGKGEVMLALAIKKAHRFDRVIGMRNWLECTVALVMAVFFGRWAYHAANGLMRAGALLITAGMLWIIYYLLRNGREAPGPAPDLTLAAFQQALLRKYEHQIRLLKSVKYWYLLPTYAGLLLLTAGMMAALAVRGRPVWPECVAIAIYTVFFAGLWWLNEVHTAGRLERERARLQQAMESGAGGSGTPAQPA